MPKIIIGNVDNDSMIGDLSKMDERLRGITSTIANRLLWLANEGDIAILPYPVSNDILAHISSVGGSGLGTRRIIAVRSERTGPSIIASDVLLSDDTLRRLEEAMGGETDWQMVSYFHTSAVSAFANVLGISQPLSTAFLSEGGAELFNSKSFFRKAMIGADLPIAEGAVCVSLAQAQLAAAQLILETGSIILKEQFNGGGDGNAVITYGTKDTEMGASRVIHIHGRGDLQVELAKLWPQLTSGRNSEVVIETYYDAAKVIYAEFEIGHDRSITHLNHGIMRMEPQWCGFEIPGNLSIGETAKFSALSQHMAVVVRDIGFRGKINFDAIITTDGRIIFSEFNGRLGGCTHIDELARRILGIRYLDSYQIVSRNKIPCLSWETISHALASGLAFDFAKGEGVIVLTENIRLLGTIEIMTIGQNLKRANELEEKFLEALKPADRFAAPLEAVA